MYIFRVPGLPMLVAALAVTGAAAAPLMAQVTVIGVQYRADQPFLEHDCFWDAASYPTSCPPANPLGGTAHVFLRNAGASPVTMQDVVFAGESLAEILVLHFQVVKRQPASIWLDNLSAPRLNALVAAGEPVWYKMDPAVLPPGGTGQIVVRLRQTPQIPSLSIQVVHSAGTTAATVPVDGAQPRISSIGFSADLTRAYLYWRRAAGPAAPVAIRLDDVDVTAVAATGSDPALPFATTVLQLAQPLAATSLHVFQGVYADGTTTTAAIRAWVNPFIHGTWGAKSGADNDFAAARAWIDDATNHSVNSLVVQLGSAALGDYLKTSEGRQYAADRGYGFVIDDIGKWSCSNPLMWFIRDEPDAADSRVTDIPGDKMVGSLAQMAVQTGETLRAADITAPTTLNLDMTYKPFNWYNYGQVADVTMSDPYYQARLREAYWSNPARIPLYNKATFVYAVSQLAQSASEPNPLHIILYSCEYIDSTLGQTFPFPTPQSKRIEFYYALAGGAKGISYWWYLKSNNASNGLGAGTPTALALWKEIGLLGAEAGIAAPLLVASCPAAVPVQPSSGLWARTLLVGTDTIILLMVNDQYSNDPAGCHYTPVANASAALTLPAWMASPSVFEVSTSGTRDVSAQQNGNLLQLSLGTVDLTRMLVITSNTQTRAVLQERYDQQFRARLCAIAPELCQNLPPTITQQPQPKSVAAGGTAAFVAGASGTAPFTYQWQKNQTDLSNTGHYTGVTASSLTVSPVDAGDAADYRCVVSNAYGSATSNEAALSLAAPPTVPGDFDGDSDVDQVDFGEFQRCLSGSSIPLVADCAKADFDQDGDVDVSDFTRFEGCLSGPDVPANSLCLN